MSNSSLQTTTFTNVAEKIVFVGIHLLVEPCSSLTVELDDNTSLKFTLSQLFQTLEGEGTTKYMMIINEWDEILGFHEISREDNLCLKYIYLLVQSISDKIQKVSVATGFCDGEDLSPNGETFSLLYFKK